MVERTAQESIIIKIRDYLMGVENILFAYIFGSFTDDKIEYFRDIDIAVFLREPTNDNLLDIEVALTNETEHILDYEYQIDLVVMNNKDIPLLANIIEGELLFTRDEDMWADYVTYIAMYYNDVSYYRDLSLKEAFIED